MIIEIAVALALFIGGAVGYTSGYKAGEEVRPVERVEPEKWLPEQHKKMMRECAIQCRRAKSAFKSYEPQTGDCNCYRRRK